MEQKASTKELTKYTEQLIKSRKELLKNRDREDTEIKVLNKNIKNSIRKNARDHNNNKIKRHFKLETLYITKFAEYIYERTVGLVHLVSQKHLYNRQDNRGLHNLDNSSL